MGKFTSIFLFIVLFCSYLCSAQDTSGNSSSKAKDINDVFNAIFRKNITSDTTFENKKTVNILPSIAYTPGTGFEFGADISGTKTFGNPKTTMVSIFDVYGAISTHERAYLLLRHNINTADNRWNIKGSWEIGKTEVLDHGIGTGREDIGTFPIKYTYFKFNESINKKIAPNLYTGLGISFDYYTNIDDERRTAEQSKTFNHFYSIKNGYPTYGYATNGISANLIYDSRDQPYRPYKGLYMDIILKTNRKLLGSEQNSVLLKTELRKYWSLSHENPEHILAFWHWGSYMISGSLPYLELPCTGSDSDQRTGRGYTISRFKGPSFFYDELEYRFPITQNKLLSGVCFINLQTANSQMKTKLFQHWEPGEGAGLRILFNKNTRSNLCIDYGVGNYGSSGVFIGLNEVF